MSSLHIDHALLGVGNLAHATARIRAEHGLIALPGGLLDGGIRNAIVPLREGRSIWPVGGAYRGLPFFIDYDIPWADQKAVRDADYAAAASPAEPASIASIDVSGVDATGLWSWLGVAPGSLPIRF
jgi:hypothetical protein